MLETMMLFLKQTNQQTILGLINREFLDLANHILL